MPRALIVDDNKENVYLLQALMQGSGYEVTTASDGAQALVQARAAVPDIVVSDILMPVMDGFSLCRAWKADPALSGVPFVFYTATYTDPKDEQFALSLGADLFIVKPAEPDEFLVRIAAVLDRQRAGRLSAGAAPARPDDTYLRTYNETLIRKLEQKLEELERANRALALKSAVIDMSVSGIAMMDLDGRCTYANASFARLWNSSQEQLLGRRLRDLVSGETSALLIAALAERGHWIGEVSVRRADGAPMVLHGAAEKILDHDGKPLCFTVSCIDVSERHRMREQLQRAQRLESLNVFARGIAHDFNNLLVGLFGNLELGMTELPPDSPARPFLDTAIRVHSRARDLTQRLQAFARGVPMVRERVDVSDILRESCALLLSGTDVTCGISVGESLPPVAADPSQLSQVFNNLLMNARQAMDDGGRVSVSISERVLYESCGTLRAGRYVEITVDDEGPGVPEDIAPQVFDPFFSTKPNGTGLGLATSYSIVKEHGGGLTVGPAPGGGARFTVLLPAAVGPAPTGGEVGRARILLMDPDPAIRGTASRMLELAGYEVRTAADEVEILEGQARALADGRPFDLFVVARRTVGDRLVEVLTRMHDVDPGAVVLLSEESADESVLARLRGLGCVGCVAKPFLAHELLSRVKAVIGRP